MDYRRNSYSLGQLHDNKYYSVISFRRAEEGHNLQCAINM